LKRLVNYDFIRFFNIIEQKCLSEENKDFLLWPNTDITDMQIWIEKFYGVKDDINIQGSRSFLIYKVINKLIQSNQLKKDYSILDICCGDALILQQLKNKYPKSLSFGFDINKGKIT